MRWPIQLQLLLPTLVVVVLAIVLSSGASSYFAGTWISDYQQAHLERVVRTVRRTNFPLTGSVLDSMSGLSGAEYVVVDGQGVVRASTINVDPERLQELPVISTGTTSEALLRSPPLRLNGSRFLAARVSLRPSRLTRPGDSVTVLFPEDRWWTQTRQLVIPPLAAGGVAVVFVVVITWWFSRRLTRPIARLCKQTDSIANGQFDALTLSRRNDEIRDLGLSINLMAARLSQYEQEVRRSERLQTLGKLGAGMAHQLRNAVTGARMATELHRRDCSEGEACESLAVAIRQLTLMETYVQRFLTHGHPGTVSRERIDLRSLTDDALTLVGPAGRHANVSLSLDGDIESLEIDGDPHALRQVLVNLLLNAIEAATRTDGQAGSVTVTLGRTDQGVVLTVEDSGPGPEESVQDRLFEPFVSQKKDGTGLGLSLARQIVEEHNGTIDWDRRNGMTCFIIEFSAIGETADHAALACS